jgi:hypothetical protein
VVLQVSQVSQEIPEEMVCLDPVVLLARKGNLGREEPVVLQVSQVFQEILEEMADLGHVVLLGRKGSLVREEIITKILSSQIGNNVFGRGMMARILA